MSTNEHLSDLIRARDLEGVDVWALPSFDPEPEPEPDADVEAEPDADAEAQSDDGAEPDEDEVVAEAALSQDRYAGMSAHEDLILTVTARGAGKLSSSHDYPVRGRGGQGVAAMDKAMRGGPLAALFPVEIDAQVMLATDAGQSIRVPVDGISFRSRSAGGVRVFSTAQGEEVVSVARIAEQGDGEEPADV